jgi:hypothetical protein
LFSDVLIILGAMIQYGCDIIRLITLLEGACGGHLGSERKRLHMLAQYICWIVMEDSIAMREDKIRILWTPSHVEHKRLGCRVMMTMRPILMNLKR